MNSQLLAHNCAADLLDDFRSDCITEGGNSVHPSGNPIIDSPSSSGTRLRFKLSRTQSVIVKPSAKHRSLREPLVVCLASARIRVGNNPEPLPGLWSANVGSWDAVPLRVIPHVGQITEHDSESVNSEL